MVFTVLSMLPINLGIFALTISMSLFFGLGTVVDIKNKRMSSENQNCNNYMSCAGGYAS